MFYKRKCILIAFILFKSLFACIYAQNEQQQKSKNETNSFSSSCSLDTPIFVSPSRIIDRVTISSSCSFQYTPSAAVIDRLVITNNSNCAPVDFIITRSVQIGRIIVNNSNAISGVKMRGLNATVNVEYCILSTFGGTASIPYDFVNQSTTCQYEACYPPGRTLAAIDVRVTDTLKWYDSQVGGNELPSTTLLVDGTTYYAANSNGTCESDRIAIAVCLENNPPTASPITAVDGKLSSCKEKPDQAVLLRNADKLTLTSSNPANDLPALKDNNDNQPWAVAGAFSSSTSGNVDLFTHTIPGVTQTKLKANISAGRVRITIDTNQGSKLTMWHGSKNIAANNWYGYYVEYNGTGMNQSGTFRVKFIDLTKNDPIETISLSLYNSRNGQVQSYLKDIDGFEVQGNSTNPNSELKIAQIVYTTLRANETPSDTEISMMISNPMQWINEYKIGETYRLPGSDSNHSSSFQLNDINAANATKVWLMGNGENDAYPNIRNQVYPSDDSHEISLSGSTNLSNILDAGGVFEEQDSTTPNQVTFDLDTIFSDEDDHTLTYEVSDNNPSITTASIEGSILTINYINEGATTITVEANDGYSTAEATIELYITKTTNLKETIWTGEEWHNGSPSSDTKITLSAPLTLNSSLEVCECKVENGATLEVQGNGSLVVKDHIVNEGSILVEDGGSVVQQSVYGTASGSGTFDVKRNSTEIRSSENYTYWSSPLTNSSLDEVVPDAVYDYYFSYDATQQDWQMESKNASMTPGVGYITLGPAEASYPSQQTANFTGSPFNTSIIEVTTSTGLNLIGNPYPSAIDAATFVAENPTVGSLYFWTHNTEANYDGEFTQDDYVSWNGVGATNNCLNCALPTGYIASGQGFFVETSADTNIRFSNNIRLTSNNTYFYKNPWKEVAPDRIWLNLYNDKGYNQLLIGFTDRATDDKDNRYDAPKMLNQGVNFYSLIDREAFAIQGRAPLQTSNTIPLGVRVAEKGTYTLGIDRYEGNLHLKSIYLYDRFLEQYHNLKEANVSLSISETDTNIDQRFDLIIRNQALSLDDISNSPSATVYHNGESIVISPLDGKTITQVEGIDLLGRILFKKQPNKSDTFFLDSPVQNSIIIIKIITKSGELMIKKMAIK